MMKTFLIPTDFSAAANNAVEYAAKLAQRVDGKLELANIKIPNASEIVIESDNCRYIKNTPEILEDMSNSIRDTFSIPCTFIAEKTDNTFQKAVSKLSSEKDLIIMGTNGADDLYQYFFGTNTYQVIKKSTCPVLVIPENSNYKAIKKVVFAWDYTPANKMSLLQMCCLLEVFHPEITLLHISRKNSMVGNEVFNAIKEEMCSFTIESMNIRYDRIFCEDTENFTDKMVDYMVDNNADLLVITHYERNFIQQIFHGNILRKLTDTSNYPLLVLHV